MADGQRRLILGNGEQYIQSVEKVPFGRTPEPPRTFEAARAVVQGGIARSLDVLRSLPSQKKLPDEAVLCFRLHPDVTAKSYDPVALFDSVPELRKVGSRYYRNNISDVAQTTRIEKLKKGSAKIKPADSVEGRLLFVQSSPSGFEVLNARLNVAESRQTGRFMEAIRRVERVDVLARDEQLSGFAKSWKEGRVELVFHPTRNTADRQLQFIFDLFDEVGIAADSSRPNVYPGGPTFVSCMMNRQSLEALADTNPLRAAHPLVFAGLADLRHAPTAPAPKPSTSATRSTIKVGVFDGGVDPLVPLLMGHVEEDTTLSIKTAPLADYIAHGTAVAGAALYGPLNGTSAKSHLPPPPVSVVSIRALPVSKPSGGKDDDLYEAIDVIENAVPKRPDIKVFNISFGPRGPILDDRVSRFTYVLDTLALKHKVAFFVAVGNDGARPGLERIQAPSDLVHGIGVGAFTLVDGEELVAPYSCRGPGRECGKIKPDLVAFGGCEQTPMHLVSTVAGKRVYDCGTSYASPVAASLGAQAAHGFERASALLSRALLIHSARHPGGKPDDHLGHGCIPNSVDELLVCDDDVVTIVFQGDILPTKIVRLPIPLPSGLNLPGKVELTWTVAGMAPIDPNHPGDYTCGCLEDTFYPHSKMFSYSPPKETKKPSRTLHIERDKAAIAALVRTGWKQSLFPVSASGNKYRGEAARRALDCKWEPTVRRSVSKFSSSINDPFLTLHAIGRHNINERFDYVAVVSIRAKKFSGDLYSAVRTQYPALAPIRLRTEAEIRVAI